METSVPLNNFAILASAVASMVIGYVWYGPLLGKMWMKEMGMSEAKMKEDMKKGAGKSYALMFVGSLLMAYVLAHSLAFGNAYLGMSGPTSGIMGAFWNWLGFIAPVLLGSVLWEGKSVKLWLINIGYYLVTLCAMGYILTVWV